MGTSLKGKDILRIEEITQEEVRLIMATAARFETVIWTGGRLQNMTGEVLATLFYEPSTRTRLSFEAAMLRLGGGVLWVAEAATASSAAKGETLFTPSGCRRLCRPGGDPPPSSRQRQGVGRRRVDSRPERR